MWRSPNDWNISGRENNRATATKWRATERTFEALARGDEYVLEQLVISAETYLKISINIPDIFIL